MFAPNATYAKKQNYVPSGGSCDSFSLDNHIKDKENRHPVLNSVFVIYIDRLLYKIYL